VLWTCVGGNDRNSLGEGNERYASIDGDPMAPLNTDGEDVKMHDKVMDKLHVDNVKIEPSPVQGRTKITNGRHAGASIKPSCDSFRNNVSDDEGCEIVNCVSDIVTVIADGLLASLVDDNAKPSSNIGKANEDSASVMCPDVDSQSIYSSTSSINPKIMAVTAVEQPHHPYKLPPPHNLRDSMRKL